MHAKDYRIRAVSAADRERWDPLWQGYLEFYESSLEAAVTERLWQRLVDAEEPISGRVAVAADDALIGLVHFFPHPHTWYTQPVCYLNDLFVDPEVRGGGVGASLIQAVVDEAREQDWAEVYWHTQQHNQVARGLYDKITGGTDGFVNYAIIMGSTAG